MSSKAKSITSVILSIILVLSYIPVSASADTACIGGNLSDTISWSLNDGVLEITGSGNMEKINGEDRFPWFEYRDVIEEAVIGDGITSIGDGAFYTLKELSKVSIPDSVTYVGTSAFNGCSSLVSVDLPDGVRTIGKYAFRNCSNLESIDMGKRIRKIDEYSFYGDYKLDNVIIPDSVSTIEKNAFTDNRIKSISFGKNLKYVDEGNFDVSYIKKLDVYSVEKWLDLDMEGKGRKMLYQDSTSEIVFTVQGEPLKELIIPEGTTDIPDYAFYCVKSIKSVVFPESLNSIGQLAFAYCDGIAELDLPEGLESLEYGSLYTKGCKILHIPSTLKKVGTDAFYDRGYEKIYINDIGNWFNNEFNGYMLDYQSTPVELYIDGKSAGEVVLPDSVTSIPKKAFKGCSNTKVLRTGDGIEMIYLQDAFDDIYLGDGVKYISGGSTKNLHMGKNVEAEYDGIGSVHVEAENVYIDSIDHLFNIKNLSLFDSKREHKIYVDGEILTDLSVPDGVKNIHAGMFNCCTDIKTLRLPESVQSIADDSFYNCTDLENIYLSSGLKKTEPDDQFKGCSNIKNVYVPDIETWYRYGKCIAEPSYESSKKIYVDGRLLTEVDNTDSDYEITPYLFSNCDAIKSVVTDGDVGRYAFYGCDGIETATMKDGTDTIRNNSFEDCTSLKSVSIGPNVSRLESQAFKGCSSIERFEVYTADILAYDFGDIKPEIWGISGSSFAKYAENNSLVFRQVIDPELVELNEYDYEYTGSQIKPEVTVDGLTEGVDYAISYGENIQPGKGEVIIAGIGDYCGSFGLSFNIDRIDIEDMDWHVSTEGTAFSWEGAEPEVTCEGLVEGRDFTVSYEDNNELGEAYALVEGKGIYEGFVELAFEVVPAEIDSSMFYLNSYEEVYDGKEKKPVVHSRVLVYGQDYEEVSYENNVEPGTAVVTIKGNKRYTGTCQLNFEICEKTAVSTLPFELSYTSIEYSGKGNRPKVICEGYKEGRDYTVTYQKDTKNGGTHRVTITGIGEYTGQKILYYDVTKKSISSVAVEIEDRCIFNGKAQEPDVLVENLALDRDYEVSYNKNINAGTDAKVIIYGIGDNYRGMKIVKFTIEQADIENMKLQIPEKYEYTRNAITPEIKMPSYVKPDDYTIKYLDGREKAGIHHVSLIGKNNLKGAVTLEYEIVPKDISDMIMTTEKPEYTYEGRQIYPIVCFNDTIYYTDFELEFKNNIDAGIGTVTATGTGNYTGQKTAEFKIIPVDLSKQRISMLNEEFCEYNGKPFELHVLRIEPLYEGVDYTVRYENNLNAGTASAIVTATDKGNCVGTVTKSFNIAKANQSMELNKGYINGTYGSSKIIEAKAKTPITYISRNKSIATVSSSGKVSFKSVGETTIRLVAVETNNYLKDALTVDVKVLPKKAGIKSIISGKKKMTVKMPVKVSSTGGKYYQIEYRVKGSKTWKKTKTTTQTKTIKNLKKGKRYQVRVRAYKTVSGETYYGAWSAIKTSKKIK